jgi:hypothetical protein
MAMDQEMQQALLTALYEFADGGSHYVLKQKLRDIRNQYSKDLPPKEAKPISFSAPKSDSVWVVFDGRDENSSAYCYKDYDRAYQASGHCPFPPVEYVDAQKFIELKSTIARIKDMLRAHGDSCDDLCSALKEFIK